MLLTWASSFVLRDGPFHNTGLLARLELVLMLIWESSSAAAGLRMKIMLHGKAECRALMAAVMEHENVRGDCCL